MRPCRKRVPYWTWAVEHGRKSCLCTERAVMPALSVVARGVASGTGSRLAARGCRRWRCIRNTTRVEYSLSGFSAMADKYAGKSHDLRPTRADVHCCTCYCDVRRPTRTSFMSIERCSYWTFRAMLKLLPVILLSDFLPSWMLTFKNGIF